MQSEQNYKLVERGDGALVVMPEMKQMKADFDDFAHEADEVITKLKQSELKQAIKKQSEVMSFLEGLIRG